MKYFKCTINKRDYKLAINTILFIQVSKEKSHMVKVVTTEEEYHIYHQLKAIEREYHQFFRCHRDTLVNRDKIRIMDRQQRLLYVGDEKRPVHYARSKGSQLKEIISND
ncbi:MAG: LytTR family transcriptional regulator DNA-binding domain-containing protein [Streptococcus orisratti]|uniref:LytTR family transcriptional regulator DNA-binding domain-containing protein n=1 Tax=Streptococcus orisratti TaxID=114652 RepID=UPI002A91CBEC|nr:LytTR family transcriptional regulator DNA-binding domain-containing protein [Streptococcus orisratti]MDY5635443.1 LytTR family transcriptional regulator DNA-binding domain-containing protein [Streptococcus orisratti]